MTSNIYDLSKHELIERMQSWGEPPFRADQLWEGLYRHLWSTADEFTNFPKPLRQKLHNSFSNENVNNHCHTSLLHLKPVSSIQSKDGETVKTLFTLADGRQIEAVLMRYERRNTLCISTQAGCAMGCVFCATGQMGFKRHLSSGEIVEQVLYYARLLAGEKKQVSNIVIMGMGEPFHNYDATMDTISRLNDSNGFNLGARKFTISTVGLVPGIRRFTAEHSQINLAISLHAADDETRSKLLPVNHKYPLNELFAACQDYVHSTHRRLSFEWALINGVNDTTEQANLLSRRLKPIRIGNSNLSHVNLILLNPTEKFQGRASNPKNALIFKSILEQDGIPCTIRLRRGIEIQAGCGQLAITSP